MSSQFYEFSLWCTFDGAMRGRLGDQRSARVSKKEKKTAAFQAKIPFGHSRDYLTAVNQPTL